MSTQEKVAPQVKSDESFAQEYQNLKEQSEQKITALTTERDKLTEKLNGLQKEITNLKKDKQTQQEKITSQQEKITLQEQKLQELQVQLDNEKNQKCKYQENFENVQTSLAKQKEETQAANLKYKQICDQQPDLKRMGEIEQKLKKEQNELKGLKNLLQQSELGKQIYNEYLKQNNNEIAKNNQNKSQVEVTDDMQGYDLQILFRSIKQLLYQGAQIKLRYSKDSTQYQNALARNAHLVCFLGLKNAGKSYWHSKLTKQPIKQGQLHATQGLNVNFVDKYWYLDGMGLGETLQNFTNCYKLMEQYSQCSKEIDQIEKEGKQNQELFDKKNQLKYQIEQQQQEILKNQNELYKEKLALEKFTQSFIMDKADVIIYVADIMTLEEQKYITQIAQQLSNNQIKIKKDKKIKQQLIILHNFKNIDTIDELKQCIVKDVFNNFAIEIQDCIDLDTCNYKDFGVSGQQVYHVIFGREGSEIEKAYNQKSIEQINQILRIQTQQGTSQNLFKSFAEYTNDHIQEYFNWGKLQIEGQEEITRTPTGDEQSLLSNNKQKQNVQKPQFELIEETQMIASIPHQQLNQKSIFCKDIMTDYMGQKINDIDQDGRTCFYQMYKIDNPDKSIIKRIVLSIPGVSLVASVKARVVTDDVRMIKILNVRIKYDQTKCKEILENKGLKDKDFDQEYYNNQQLKFQNMQIDIPFCKISQSCVSQINPQYQSELSAYVIDIQINDDGANSEFSSDDDYN